MAERAQVQNASAGRQVRRAGRNDRNAARIAQLDAKAVMQTPEGRRFVWWLLGKAGINESVMKDGESRVLYWAGRQDMGRELQVHVITTDADAYLLMQREAIAVEQEVAATAIEDDAGMASEPPEAPVDE